MPIKKLGISSVPQHCLDPRLRVTALSSVSLQGARTKEWIKEAVTGALDLLRGGLNEIIIETHRT